MDLDELRRAVRDNAALRSAADSPEARALAEGFDGAAAEAALRSGDAEALRALLGGVLGSPEGRRLAEAVRDAVREHG